MSTEVVEKLQKGIIQSKLLRDKEKPKISAIVVIRNIADSFEQLHSKLFTTLNSMNQSFEIIYIDDGSNDSTYSSAKRVACQIKEVKSIRLRSTFGEASAFDAGIKQARGEHIVYFAGRVLINPHEIPKLLSQLTEDADIVIGWRFPRRDWLLNRILSWLFNKMMRILTGLKLHDINSGIFVTKKEVLLNLPIYGDMNNFIPVLATRQGYKVTEFKVEQMAGTFRLSRYPKEYLQRLLDIITVLFLTNYSKKPLHFLGFIGGVFTVFGGAIELYLFIYRILGFGGIAGRPLLLLGAMLLVIGLQMISIGLIGEMIIFTHANEIKEYNIAEIIE